MTRAPYRAIAPVLAALVAAALVGCADPRDAERADDEMRTTVEPEWVHPADAVGDGVAVVDGTALAYVLEDDRLAIAAVDVRTGAELWRARTTTGAVATEVRGSPRILWGDDRTPLVAVMAPPSVAPGEAFGHRVELRDPRSGSVTHRSEAIWMHDPHDCRSTDGICFTGYEETSETGVAMRLDPDSAAIEPFTDVLPGFDRFRHVAGSVYFAGLEGRLVLMNLDDDDVDTEARDAIEKPRWEVPFEDVFGDGFVDTSSDWLSAGVIGGVDDERTLLAWVAPAPEGDVVGAAHLAEGRLVAVDLDTGKPLWERTGVRPCAAEVVCRNETGFTANSASESSGLRTYEREAGVITMEGVDVRTGEVAWSIDVDAAAARDDSERHLIDPSGYDAMRDGGHVVLLDVETGVVRDLADGERLACTREVAFRAHDHSDPFSELVDYRIGGVVESCGGEGPADGQLSRAAVRAAAASWVPADDERRRLGDGPGDDDPMDEELRRVADGAEDEVRWRVLQTAEGIVGYRF